MGFRIFWGRLDSGVKTRLEMRFLNTISGAEVREGTAEYVTDELEKALDGANPSDVAFDRFERSSLSRKKESLIIVTPLAYSEDRFNRENWRYFRSYWAMAMSPAYATMLKLAQRKK
jgi:hypothetical protein